MAETAWFHRSATGSRYGRCPGFLAQKKVRAAFCENCRVEHPEGKTSLAAASTKNLLQPPMRTAQPELVLRFPLSLASRRTQLSASHGLPIRVSRVIAEVSNYRTSVPNVPIRLRIWPCGLRGGI